MSGLRNNVFARIKKRLQQKGTRSATRSEEHTSELQSLRHLVCRLLLEKKKNADVDGSASESVDLRRHQAERGADRFEPHVEVDSKRQIRHESQLHVELTINLQSLLLFR